jgi:hypothetical protein
MYPPEKYIRSSLKDLLTHLAAAQSHVVGDLLGMLSKKIRGRKDLNFSIGETNFYAYYVQRVEAYIFQTLKRSVYDFHAKAR